MPQSATSAQTKKGAPVATPVAPSAPINAVELLQTQHREVEALFTAVLETSDRAVKKRAQLFDELALKLTAHTKIEEKIFYPAGRAVEEDMTLEAVEEHSVAKALIRKIQGTDPSDETYAAKVTVLKEIIEHHVKEEEGEYFPKVSQAVGEERLLELGTEMQALFERTVASGTARSPSRSSKAH